MRHIGGHCGKSINYVLQYAKGTKHQRKSQARCLNVCLIEEISQSVSSIAYYLDSVAAF